MLRYRREALDQLIDDINAAGYGLTFGLHTRIDETIARVTGRIRAGNIYINRNTIGAVVGVQPFGGEGLSGTGPKAGGPLYLERLITRSGASRLPGRATIDPVFTTYCQWLQTLGYDDVAAICRRYADAVAATISELSGPVGERNIYALQPIGRIVCIADTVAGALRQIGAALATGNTVMLQTLADMPFLPDPVAARVEQVANGLRSGAIAAVLFDGDSDRLAALNRALSSRAGPLIRLQALRGSGVSGQDDYRVEWLLHERTITTNTAAAGGNASLMTIG